jgi:hypothetical protein
MGIAISLVTIPKYIKKIDSSAFLKCNSLWGVVCAIGGESQEIDALNWYCNLVKIDIPGSVEIMRGFSKYKSLRELIFRTGRLRKIGGFNDCPSLSIIKIPRSVENINGFNSLVLNCTRDKRDSLRNGLNEVIFADDCELKEMEGFNGCELLKKIGIPCSIERLCGCNSIFLKDWASVIWGERAEPYNNECNFV